MKDADTTAPVGRPSKYTQEIAEAFCDRIAHSRTAKEALADIGNPVSWATIKRWLKEHEDFRALYARAREDQADNDVDEMRNIVRRATGGPLADGETALGYQEARLAVDVLKWTAGKRQPKVYGNEVEIGEGGGSVVLHVVTGVPRPDK